MQIVSAEDDLHEISKPVFCENNKNIIYSSSAELVQRVVMVNTNNKTSHYQNTPI